MGILGLSAGRRPRLPSQASPAADKCKTMFLDKQGKGSRDKTGSLKTVVKRSNLQSHGYSRALRGAGLSGELMSRSLTVGFVPGFTQGGICRRVGVRLGSRDPCSAELAVFPKHADYFGNHSATVQHQPQHVVGIVGLDKGRNHMSSTTCLTQVFFKRDESM